MGRYVPTPTTLGCHLRYPRLDRRRSYGLAVIGSMDCTAHRYVQLAQCGGRVSAPSTTPGRRMHSILMAPAKHQEPATEAGLLTGLGVGNPGHMHPRVQSEVGVAESRVHGLDARYYVCC